LPPHVKTLSKQAFMPLAAIVIGTGLRSADGSSRSRVIRRHCTIGCEVLLRIGLATGETSHAVAVYLEVSRLFGLLRSSYAQIGYLDPNAADSIAPRLHSGGEVRARVKNVYAPEEKDSPRVSLVIE